MIRKIFYFIVLGVIGCKSAQEDKPLEHFEMPQIVQLDTFDSIQHLQPPSIWYSDPAFAGKYKFTKKISLHFDSVMYRLPYLKLDKADIFEAGGKRWKEISNLKSDGFQLIADYNTNIAFKLNKNYEFYNAVFPIYIVNNTQNTQLLEVADNQVAATQEAKDTKGVWNPIEKTTSVMCGNSYWQLRVHPREFVMCLMRKYEGNFKTQLRVRLKMNGKTYLSEPYDGTIDSIQFSKMKEKWW